MEEKKVHKGLIGYKVFIKRWSDVAERSIMKELLMDLAGYGEAEAEKLLGSALPVLIADDLTHSGAVYLAAAFEMYGCTTDVYYKAEHILFNEEIPEIFTIDAELTEKARYIFENITNRNRISFDEEKEKASGSFSSYHMSNERLIMNHKRRPVDHKTITQKPLGYIPEGILGWQHRKGGNTR